MFEICLQYYVIIFHKKQNWEKYKSKLILTHISALKFWINNIVLKTKKLLEYAMFNQNTYSIAMRTTYGHWFVYFMIKSTALINQLGQNRTGGKPGHYISGHENQTKAMMQQS